MWLMIHQLIIMNSNKAKLTVKCSKIFYWAWQNNIICHLVLPHKAKLHEFQRTQLVFFVTAPQFVCIKRMHGGHTLEMRCVGIKATINMKKILTRLRFVYCKDEFSTKKLLNKLWFGLLVLGWSRHKLTRSTVPSAIVQFPSTVRQTVATTWQHSSH